MGNDDTSGADELDDEIVVDDCVADDEIISKQFRVIF
jgi:hypothetical protein